jgi:maltooligosyltrehalose trehalohydrolase
MDFRLWAPKATMVEIALANTQIPMTPCAGGWWIVDVPAAGPATEYSFILDNSAPLPDPRSACQPHGVHGPSRVIDHQAIAWTDERWQPGPLSAAMLYELHIGTFTPAGTFEAAIEHLDHLVELGIIHVELLPVAEFPGVRG